MKGTETGTGTIDAQEARRRLVAMIPASERRLELAGISTAVLEGGNGRPVVLLHGPGGYGAHWMRVIPGLVKRHRVVAPDLPGHGATDAGDGTLGADRVLQWLGELIERTCVEPPIVVGHLVGGAIAARFAITRGDRIRALVLTDTLGLTPFRPAPAFEKALTDFISAPDLETHDLLWEQCAFDLTTLRQRMGAVWEPFAAYNVERAQSASVPAAMHALIGGFGAEAIPAAELERIRVPTTLIWGRHDVVTPISVAETASKRFGWPLIVIDNSANALPVEQPEAVVATLDKLLATGG